jgi:Secretion system C-terminal sorting domain/Kelch motif/Galactose oxidase, central domain
MTKAKTIYLFAMFICIAIVYGFYSGNNGNNPNADTPKNTGIVTPMTEFVNPNPSQGDLLAPTWSSGAAEPTGTTFNQYCTYVRNDTAWLYVWGNTPPTAIAQRYNITTNTWTTVAANPTPVDRGCSCALKDSIYIAGGYNGGGATINAFQKYDINSNTWTTRANLPGNNGWGKIVAYQDSLIYLCGGFDGVSVTYATVYVYNALNNTWTVCTPMPNSGRFGGGFAISGDTLVYAGGADASLFYATTFKGVISQTNRSIITWTAGVNMPAPYNAGVYRTDAGSWGCKGIILCNGSTTSAFTPTNGCMSYSPGLDAWTVLPNKPNASLYCALGTVKLSGNRYKLVTAGGYNGTFMTNVDILSDTLCPAGLPSLCEQFSTTTFPPIGWTNTANGTYPWAYNVASGFGVGTGSAMARMYLAPLTETESLTSLAFTPTPAQTGLFVDMAYAQWSPNLTAPDSLVIFSSTNGGTTYTTLASLGYTEMATTAPMATEFTAPTASQWAKRIYALPIGTNKVQFYYHSGFGNDLYIDSICTGSIVGISNNGGVVPHAYSLSQNYPNPFNPSTVIKYSLPKAGLVKLVVFDILGREVRTLVNEVKTAGIYSVNFDASSLASGVYFYKVESGDFVQTKKMLLIK